MIDNQICLTAINEQGAKEFPDWIPRNAHKRLVGCMQCQEICPKNQSAFGDVTETIEYTGEETSILLFGKNKILRS